jgi:hypothetical protein
VPEPSPDFQSLLSGPSARLVIFALHQGLCILRIDNQHWVKLQNAGINPFVVQDELFRQLDQMPSLSVH